MKIREFYYMEDLMMLNIDFSTTEDGDDFYRNIMMSYDDVNYYSPEFITEEELNEVDDNFLAELIERYLTENEIPEQIVL